MSDRCIIIPPQSDPSLSAVFAIVSDSPSLIARPQCLVTAFCMRFVVDGPLNRPTMPLIIGPASAPMADPIGPIIPASEPMMPVVALPSLPVAIDLPNAPKMSPPSCDPICVPMAFIPPMKPPPPLNASIRCIGIDATLSANPFPTLCDIRLPRVYRCSGNAGGGVSAVPIMFPRPPCDARNPASRF